MNFPPPLRGDSFSEEACRHRLGLLKHRTPERIAALHVIFARGLWRCLDANLAADTLDTLLESVSDLLASWPAECPLPASDPEDWMLLRQCGECENRLMTNPANQSVLIVSIHRLPGG